MNSECWITLEYLTAFSEELAGNLKELFKQWTQPLKDARKQFDDLRRSQWFVAQPQESFKYNIFVPSIECSIQLGTDPYDQGQCQILVNTNLQDAYQLNGLQVQNITRHFTVDDPEWTFPDLNLAQEGLEVISSKGKMIKLLNKSLNKKEGLLLRTKNTLEKAVRLGKKVLSKT